MNNKPGRGPRPLGEAISQLIAERGLAGSAGLVTLNELWKEIVGDEIGGRTKIIGIKNGALEVGVANSALLNELAGFYSQDFLQLIQADDRGRSVRGIRFRLKR